MSREIKAIETVYKGYRFRSRLEARWAVFFDSLNVKWEYEPEGFKFEASKYYGMEETFYLPDFYLPDFDLYVEIKPCELSELETYKCERLRDKTDKPVIALIGTPGQFLIDGEEKDGKIFCWDMKDSSAGPNCFDFVLYSHDAFGLVFAAHDSCPSRDFCRSYMFETEHRIIQFALKWDDAISITKTRKAATEARSARFEHGESPFNRRPREAFSKPF